ncbi:MAG: type I-C CRISPR-associated protein Cas8c/Csd1 [Cytophagales bacterium]|nr:type I-C CRISPR-associated protein Cas8c/Csd1 [Cytophagales bacterium]
MILTALNDYYQRLLANSGLAKVPPYGFSEQQISYCLVLSKDGVLVDIEDVRDTSDKKPRAKFLSVPNPQKKSVNISPNFLWGNSQYLVGLSSKPMKRSIRDYFESFRKRTALLTATSTDVGLIAINKFLASWSLDETDKSLIRNEMLDLNCIFKLDGDFEYLHNRPAALTLWNDEVASKVEDNRARQQCLITGKYLPVARLHDPIKGGFLAAQGGKSSGVSIVSFNAEAYTSYGKDQGDNAPVSEAAAFGYTTALNYLLRRNNGQCISIGDTSTVFWAIATDAAQASAAESLFGLVFNMPADDKSELTQIKPVLEKIAQGKPLAEIAPDLAEGTRFYVLGLAPNASRLSIRYWLDTSFGELAQHVAQHFKDLALDPLPWREPPSVWRLLIQTASQGKSENIPPQLAGELLRSIITGQRYPRMLLAQLVQRIRADGDLNGLRAALLKAVLVRDYRKGFIQEEIPMGLDEQNMLPAYRLGRLFAVLERIQEGALGKDVNATIADRYYGTASSVPYSVFPRLLAGCKNHLSKIRKDKPGYAVNLNKDLASVIEGLPSEFPKHFSIEQQGQFAIGYYHQKQSYFAKKADTTAESDNTPTLGD